jgi:hypothetical protein
MQGDASRRFLLQSKLQANFNTKSGDLSSEEVESDCIVTKVRSLLNDAALSLPKCVLSIIELPCAGGQSYRNGNYCSWW